MWRQILIGVLLSLALSTQADTQMKMSDRWRVEVGGGGAIDQTPWRGVNIQSTPLPFVSASKGRWGFGVGEGIVQYALFHSDIDINVGLGYRDETYQSAYAIGQYDSDDPVFNGYQSPKGELTAQLHVEKSFFHFRLAQDIQNRSRGATATFRADVPLYRHSSGWQVGGRVGGYWLQDKYASHVFGVSAGNADERFGRHQYAADSALNYFVGLKLYIPITSRHSLRGFSHYEFLDEQITDSPLVDRDYRAQVGLIYVVTLLNGI